MVESKDFTTFEESVSTDTSPPLVSVPAGEPLDVWHLHAVPVMEPSPPLCLYDDDTNSSSYSVPTIIANEHHNESIGRYWETQANEDVPDLARQGAGLAGVLGL
jgi:hypothetical protein